MNPIPVGGPVPPQIPLPASATAVATLANPVPGELPEDREPVSGAFGVIEAVLRHPRRLMYRLRQPAPGSLIGLILFTALLCGVIYGLVVGTFSGGTQLWAAPVKIAIGLLVSALICLPSLYIFGCLSGSRAGLAEIFGLLSGLLLLMTLLLIGFAPVAWLFSQSTASIAWMGTLHLLFWFVATCFGLRFLVIGFSYTQSRSLAGVATWIIIFMLVMLQMTTALRPLIGTADTLLPKEKKFFLVHWAEVVRQEAGLRR